MLRLNIGCGEYYADGWTNLDLQSCPHRKDISADVRALPFPDGCCERVYVGHLLEHLAPDSELPAALAEIRRVLADGGRFMAVGPDIARADTDELRERIVNGERRWGGDRHQWTCSEAVLLAAVRGVFPDAAAVAPADIGAEWPAVSRIGWQCAVTALR